MFRKLLFVVLLAWAADVLAQSRVVRLPYTSDLITIQAAPMHVTVIELEIGERIESIIVGDSERWIIETTEGSDGRPLIIVKPTTDDIQTNMVVMTTMRAYNFELKSGPKSRYYAYVRIGQPPPSIVHLGTNGQATPPPSSAATTPAPQPKADLSPPAQKNYNYDYNWERSAGFPWSPEAVYDDGQRTYIRVPTIASRYELPVLRVYEDGEPVVVNYAVRDGMYVVDRVFQRAELVIGADLKKGFLGLGGYRQKARKLIITRRKP